MKTAELNDNNLDTDERELENIVFSGVTDKIVPSSVAVILGCDPAIAISRAKMGANFYRNGGARSLIVSGGVKHEHSGEEVSEAEIMKRTLIEEGVPESDIIMENRARSTVENMIFSYPEAIWRLGENEVKSVTVITSSWHLKRSLILAKYFMPDSVSIYGYAENIEDDLKNYRSDPTLNKFVKNEVKLLSWNISHSCNGNIEI